MRLLLQLTMLVILASPVAAGERLVVISTPANGRATLSAIDTAGAQPRTVARLNRAYRHDWSGALGVAETMNDLGADTVLLGEGTRAIQVNLTTGAVTDLQSLLRGRAYADFPVFRVNRKLATPFSDVAISPDRRYAIVPACRNIADEGDLGRFADLAFALVDARSETVVWEQFAGNDYPLAGGFNTARFSPHGVILFIDDTMYCRAYRASAPARPIASGSRFLAADEELTWAVLADRNFANPRLFNLTTLRERSDIVIPERAGQFSFSPNGRWLAYEVATRATTDNEAGVYQVNLLTGATDRFCAGRAHNSRPTYSPGSAVLCWLEPPAMAQHDTGPLRPTRLSLRQNRRTKTIDLPLQPDDALSIIGVTGQGVWLMAATSNPPASAASRRGLTVRYYRVPWSGRTPELWYTHPYEDGREYECFVP